MDPIALEQEVRILARRVWIAQLCGDRVLHNRYADRLNALLLAASGFERDEPVTATDAGQGTIAGGFDVAA